MGVQESLIATLKSIPGFGDMVKEAASTDPSAMANAAVEETLRLVRFLGIVECAYLIASADGTTSADEVAHIKDNVQALTEGAISGELVDGYLRQAAKNVESDGRDARIQNLASVLKEAGDREAAFLVGASAAWTGGGVGTQEGLAMQAIARAFGWEISHMHKLLGKARG